MTADEIALFLDTNTLLHYPPLRDVDWRAAAGADAVRLVLCMQVVHELDDKKNDPRLADRASRAIKELESAVEAGGVIRDGVVLEVFNYEVRNADFPDTLSPDSKDDRIVHSLKKYLERHPDAHAAVYTEDWGMKLRCNANGVAFVCPDAATRLATPASEQDRKYKTAITELNDLKNRAPKVELVIAAAGAEAPVKVPLVFDLPPVPPEGDLDAEVEHYVREKGLRPLEVPELADGEDLIVSRPSVMPDGPDPFEQYNAELEAHLEQYRHWLILAELHGRVEANVFRFSVWLTNVGGAPAEDLALEIEFDAIVGRAADGLPPDLRLPDPPERPEHPLRRPLPVGSLGWPFPQLRTPELRVIAPPPRPRASVKQVREGGPYRLTYSLPRLKHHDHDNVGDFFAVAGLESDRPFKARYRVLAGNLLKPLEGELHFVVRRRSA